MDSLLLGNLPSNMQQSRPAGAKQLTAPGDKTARPNSDLPASQPSLRQHAGSLAGFEAMDDVFAELRSRNYQMQARQLLAQSQSADQRHSMPTAYTRPLDRISSTNTTLDLSLLAGSSPAARLAAPAAAARGVMPDPSTPSSLRTHNGEQVPWNTQKCDN